MHIWLEIKNLLIKLPEDDLTAVDACYHLKCVEKLYNKLGQHTVGSSSNDHSGFDE